MLNHIDIMGRIGHDLELKHTLEGTSVCSFTVAVDRNRKNRSGTYDTDWIRCVSWGKTAEFISQRFGKGDMICLEGHVQTRNYTDKSGQKRDAVEIIVEQAHFAGAKKQQDEQRSAAGAYYAEALPMAEDDYELPFD